MVPNAWRPEHTWLDSQQLNCCTDMKFQPIPDLLIILTAALATVGVSCSTVEVSPASYSSLACISGAGESSSGGSDTDSGKLFLFIYDAQSGQLENFTSRQGIPNMVEFGTTNGAKKAVATANIPEEFFTNETVNCYESICAAYKSFVEEDPAAIAMTGETSFNAASGVVLRITLVPLASRITVRSLKVDFSGRSYSGASLENVRAYIINANGRCPILDEEPQRATEVLCQGRFESADSARMLHPEMIVSHKVPGCQLFCYPCESVPNLCTTRLVIEGSVEGQTYYYPIDIVPGVGVPRGKSLIYDITITRKGSLDPDIPLEAGTLSLGWNILNWNEYEEENIVY